MIAMENEIQDALKGKISYEEMNQIVLELYQVACLVGNELKKTQNIVEQVINGIINK